MNRYPRDMRGHGPNPPTPEWPGGAKIAVQFVVNYEEGGENCTLHGDEGSEAFLSEIVGAASWPGQRHANMESIYEYGARAGFWRLYRLFTEMDVPVTVVLGATEIPVRRLLQLGPGAVLTLEKSIEEPAELFLKGSKFAEADVVVVDNRFAVRIKRITGTGAAGQADA